MGAKYVPFAEAKQKIASLNLKTRKEYITYVQSNNINFLPAMPEVIYPKHWVGFADFLGLTEEQYKANKKAQWAEIVKTRKPYTKPTKKTTNKTATTPKPVVVKGLDPDKVIKFLITEDVEPTTIAKMVAEMDIHSSSLMNELCKHMQERSKRQAQLWRPIGYQTAEAEFSKVG